VICILVFIAPFKHTVTPVYHEAVERWMASESIYINTINAYFYFPQFVLIFMPFHLLPIPLSDILWRIVSSGLLVWAIWRIVSLSRSLQNELLFLYMSLIALSPSLGAMYNGQGNVIFAALTVHAAASLAGSQWWIATLCMVGALAVKPIGLVMLLLAVVVYRTTIWRLAIGLVIFLSLPLFFAEPSYVFSQYQQSFEHLYFSSLVTEHRFADLNGLLRTIGIGLTGSASQIVRIGAGLLTMVLWWIGSKRTHEPERAWLLLGLASTYLMLFNPLTEGNSYVIVAPSIALYAVRFLKIEVNPGLGWGLVFMGFSIGLFPEIFRSVDKNFGLWWRPVTMIIFSVILVFTIFSKRFLAR
jgi:alpha-1,2-mannosyltransferase